ncbi:stage V sporulation protein S [Kitasatospora purpeofusca]|uniref:stage V sporulation protein S n=1 Tax=Kitasatospora purpeofusca TaxID=67352 RepID=UPI0036ADC245
MNNQESAEETIFRVRSSTASSELGSAIAHAVRGGNSVVLRAVGAGAVNQAVKAFPIAKSFVAPLGIMLSLDANFFQLESTQGDIVGISLHVTARK